MSAAFGLAQIDQQQIADDFDFADAAEWTKEECSDTAWEENSQPLASGRTQTLPTEGEAEEPVTEHQDVVAPAPARIRLALVPTPAPRTTEQATPAQEGAISVPSHEDVKKALDEIRRGLEIGENGKLVKRPDHLVVREVWQMFGKHLQARGETFRAPYPYYHDKATHTVTRIDYTTPELARTLRKMGLLAGERHTAIVEKNLALLGGLAPMRELHRLSYFDRSTIYLNMGANRMLRITSDAIDEVPLGTDDVILLTDDIGLWPSLEELQPHIDALRPQVGNACTRLIPELALAKYITSRWAKRAKLSPEQAHQMLFSRFLFISVASEYPTWPLVLTTGMEGSGKSTPGELQLALLHNSKKDAQALPREDGDFIASVTNDAYLVYDNIDGAGLGDKHNAHFNDRICQLATGAEIPLRKLFSDNQNSKYKTRNHALFSACTNPFPRSDTQRRVITLEIEPAVAGELVPKQKLVQAVLDNRPAMLAEFALRSQNILRAHLAVDPNREAPVYQSAMTEYEEYTLICAEYEGTLDETRDLWSSYGTQYREAISADNAMVYAVRLWLGGKAKNAGRKVSTTTLFGELQSIYQFLNQKFLYTAPNSFGAAITKNLKPLQVLGFDDRSPNTGRVVWFSPSAEELERCKRLHDDSFATASSNRIPYDNADDM